MITVLMHVCFYAILLRALNCVSKSARENCVQPPYKSARNDDASFSNVRALADASSCKAANKSTI